MKYIRTKDGRIIDLTSKQVSSYEIIDDKRAVDEYGEDSGFIMVYYYNRDIGEHIEYDNKGGHSMDNWYLKDVIKQANNIEELCDEFVIYAKEQPNGKLIYTKGFGDLKKEFIDFEKDKNEVIIYGAIWTDKGLIFVARMNNEGVLELL